MAKRKQLTLFPQPPQQRTDLEYHIQELRDLCEIFGVNCTDKMILKLIDNLNERKDE